MFIKRRLCPFLIIILGFALLNNPAWAAQTITAHSNVSLIASVSDFNAGEKVSTNNAIDWTSDENWHLEIRSLSVDLGDSDDTSYTKPLSDFLYKLSSSGTWTAITTNWVTVDTGTTPPTLGSWDFDYKFLLSWASDLPGTYTANLEFQVTAL